MFEILFGNSNWRRWTWAKSWSNWRRDTGPPPLLESKQDDLAPSQVLTPSFVRSFSCKPQTCLAARRPEPLWHAPWAHPGILIGWPGMATRPLQPHNKDCMWLIRLLKTHLFFVQFDRWIITEKTLAITARKMQRCCRHVEKHSEAAGCCSSATMSFRQEISRFFHRLVVIQ